ncbi:MAG: hypothetical protein AABW67_05680 [Nanoarchaeota archaeon]
MEFKCEACNRNFETKESLDQHNFMKHTSQKSESKKINFKKYFIIIAVIIIVVLIVLSILNYAKKPGQYDEFAKCLKEKGAVIYGNDYCSYTTKQLGFFGKSQKLLNYVKCIDNEELCNSKGVDITPTWEINEKIYSGVQTFEALAAYSGCKL